MTIPETVEESIVSPSPTQVLSQNNTNEQSLTVEQNVNPDCCGLSLGFV